MNWPNRLTVSRLVLTIIFVWALTARWACSYTLALGLFVLAGVTDYLDGKIARTYAIVTNFGKLMDPLVDKIMTAAGFICLVPLGAVPAWVAITVVARDFLITGLRLTAASQGEILPAERLGKHKTSWQIATILFFLALLSLRELKLVDGASLWWLQAWNYGGTLLIIVVVVLTLYSGSVYLWRHRNLIAPE